MGNMKKKLLSILLLICMIFGLVACGGLSESSTNKTSKINFDSFDPAKIKTMADFLKYKDTENFNYQEMTTEDYYIVVLDINGVNYRCTAKLPQDAYNELNQIEDFDLREKKMQELNATLQVEKIENLNDKIPKQEELDKYIGKTGSDLFNEGWDYYYYNLEEMEAGMNYGLFSYTVAFDYSGPKLENTDDFDFYKEFGDLKVKSVKYSGIGNATDINY